MHLCRSQRKKLPKGRRARRDEACSMHVARKTQEALVDTGATYNFMSPRVVEWLGLKPTKDKSWFTTVNAEERQTKGVVKNVDLRIGRWIGNVDFNIINMDELRVVLGMDFMEKSSTTLNPYCEVMAVTANKKAVEAKKTPACSSTLDKNGNFRLTYFATTVEAKASKMDRETMSKVAGRREAVQVAAQPPRFRCPRQKKVVQQLPPQAASQVAPLVPQVAAQPSRFRSPWRKMVVQAEASAMVVLTLAW
ncbi:hypothetical protein RJ639_015699 [Escallonia herrerae]|uniref:Uncharacterized protein n=1 Tax=Escallonia herrerae TaxID=1293975 RepID=A0AA88VCX8_9ASTE|nr:hypothetical protein RJ639_015699 [Escallonia herrerae]